MNHEQIEILADHILINKTHVFKSEKFNYLRIMKSNTEHNQTPNSYRPHCISFLGYPINFGVLPKINENYKIINKFELTETK